MKNLIITSFIMILLFCGQVSATEFVRNLPEKELLVQLTTERFHFTDAVIILNEQSFQINDRDIFYRGYELRGKSIIENKVFIVKLLNEKAVQKYGTYEFEYPEWYGNEIPCGFEVNIRVQKADGKVNELDEDNISKIVSRKTSSGIPLARKILAKIPDLAPNDVIQIESRFTQPLARSYSGIFFYSSEDFTLYSNLYVTLPSSDEVEFSSFPESIIGKPSIQPISNQFGAGNTYFWSVKNLNPIPNEPYCRPFADRTLMTTFVVKKSHGYSPGNWQNLTKDFFKTYMKDDKINSRNIEALGFEKKYPDMKISFSKIDSLYTVLRNEIVLSSSNSLYPLSEDINNIFESKDADASDLAYAMYKILEEWGLEVDILWIRDKRQGLFEKTVPSKKWFDRLAIKVKIGETSKIYDFDRSIPSRFETPWYFNNCEIVWINKSGWGIELLKFNSSAKDNSTFEKHILSFNSDFSIMDNMDVEFIGSKAQSFRYNNYSLDKQTILDDFKKDLLNSCLKNLDLIGINSFLNERNVLFNISGKSSANIDSVDSKLFFHLKNHNLRDFRNEIYSILRKTHFFFRSPFIIDMQWEIKIPKNYSIEAELLGEHIINGPSDSNANISFEKNEDKLVVKSKTTFPNNFIDVKEFPKLISFLDKNLELIEKNIILTKN